MTAKEKLKAIAKILDSGHEKDAYYNLKGAMQDIDSDDGRCDHVSMSTLKHVQNQILEVFNVLEDKK